MVFLLRICNKHRLYKDQEAALNNRSDVAKVVAKIIRGTGTDIAYQLEYLLDTRSTLGVSKERGRDS